MGNKKNHIDDILLRSATAPREVNADLSWDGFTTYQNGKKRKRLFLWWFTGAAIAIMGIGLLVPRSVDTNVDGATPKSEQNTIIQNPDIKHDDLAESKDFMQNDTSAPSASKEPIAPPTEGKQTAKVVSQVSEIVEIDWSIDVPEIVAKPFYGFAIPAFPRANPSRIVLMAPEKDDKQSKENTWTSEISAGVAFANPTLKPKTSGSAFLHKDYLDIRNQFENKRFGYSIDLRRKRSFGKWSMSLGIGLTSLSTSANYDFQYSDRPILDLDGRVLGYTKQSELSIKWANNHNYLFVNLPLQVQRQIFNQNNQRLALYLMGEPTILSSANGSTPDAQFLDQKDALDLANYRLTGVSLGGGLKYYTRLWNQQCFIDARYVQYNGSTHQKNLYTTSMGLFMINLGIQL